MKKRILSLILTFLIIFTMLPIFASAETYTDLWLQETIDYETSMGKMIDEISGTKGEYLELALSTNGNDREKFVNHVINIYGKLTFEQQQEITKYLIGYVDAVQDENLSSFVKISSFINDKTQKNTSSLAVAYDWEKARNYAIKYAYNYNYAEYPDLSNFGNAPSDCANFVSQCLYTGGKSKSGDWYIYKLNNNNPVPSTVAELDASWNLADPSPWISAKEFGGYWSINAVNTKTYDVTDYLALSNRVITGYGIGDVIQTLRKSIFNYYPEHTMILTSISGSDFKYSAHSNDKADANLTTALGSYTTYRIKFYAMY